MAYSAAREAGQGQLRLPLDPSQPLLEDCPVLAGALEVAHDRQVSVACITGTIDEAEPWPDARRRILRVRTEPKAATLKLARPRSRFPE